MSAVAVLTPEELALLVRAAVRAELDAQSSAEREILTREQAAELLQVHPTVVARYVGLPAQKLVTRTTPQEAHALAADRLRRAGVRPRVPSPYGKK